MRNGVPVGTARSLYRLVNRCETAFEIKVCFLVSCTNLGLRSQAAPDEKCNHGVFGICCCAPSLLAPYE